MSWWFLCAGAGLFLIASLVCMFAMYLLNVRGKYRHIPSPRMARLDSNDVHYSHAWLFLPFYCDLSFWLGHFPEIERERTKGLGDNPTDELFLKWCGNDDGVHSTWLHIHIMQGLRSWHLVRLTFLVDASNHCIGPIWRRGNSLQKGKSYLTLTRVPYASGSPHDATS